MEERSAMAGLVLYAMASKPGWRWMGLVSDRDGGVSWPARQSQCTAVAIRTVQHGLQFAARPPKLEGGLLIASFNKWQNLDIRRRRVEVQEGERVSVTYGAPNKSFIVETQAGAILLAERPKLRYRDGSLYFNRPQRGHLVTTEPSNAALRFEDVIADVLSGNAKQSPGFKARGGRVITRGDQARRVQLVSAGKAEVVRLPGFLGEIK